MQTQSLAEVEEATRTHLTAAIALVDKGTPDPAEPQVGPAPCDGSNGAAGTDGRFYVSGYSHVTLPADQHRSALAKLRDQASATGYEVVSSRDLAGDTGGELRLRVPADGFSITWASSGDRVWLALIVRSPCVVPPDGRYPG